MENIKKLKKRMLVSYYTYGGLGNAYFYMPILVIYFSSIFNPIQTSILISIKSITTLVFEIPTGIVADKIGRRFSIQLGFFLNLVCLFIFVFQKNFIAFIFAQFIFGVSETFISGSDSSWIYDNLRYLSYENIYEKAIQRLYQVQCVVLVISYSAGSFLYEKNNVYPFIATIICTILALLICSTIVEYKYKDNEEKVNHVHKGFLTKYKNHPAILWFYIIFSNLIMGIICTVYVYIAPLLLDASNIPNQYLGFVYSAGLIFAAISSGFSDKVKRKKLFLSFYAPIIILILCLFCFIANIHAISAILFITCIRALWGVYDVSYTNEVNQTIKDSSIRATLFSVGSGISGGAAALITLICGILIENFTIKYAIVIIGVIAFTFGGLFMLLIKTSSGKVDINK